MWQTNEYLKYLRVLSQAQSSFYFTATVLKELLPIFSSFGRSPHIIYLWESFIPPKSAWKVER